MSYEQLATSVDALAATNKTLAQAAADVLVAAQAATNTLTKQYPFTFVTGQAQYDVGVISGDSTATTAGLAVWVEGALEYSFVINNAKKFTFSDPTAFLNGAQMRIIINARFDDLVNNFGDLQDGLTAENAANYLIEKQTRTGDYYSYLGGLQLESAVPYASGLSLVRPTQTVTQTGVLYRPKAALLPFTTASWVGDVDKFVVANDTALRDDLANSTDPLKGAGLIFTKDRATLAVPVSVRDKNAGYRTLRDFGAKGNGTNDTAAILNAAASGENIWIDDNFIFQDAMIELTNGQTWAGIGRLTQNSVTISNIPANPSASYGSSNYPAFRLSSDGAMVKGFSVIAAWEGVQMAAPNTRVQDMKLVGQPVNYYDGIVAYADNVEIISNHISKFGMWMTGASYAKRGEGIFLSNGATFNKTAKVIGNTCIQNAKNGLFVIGFRDVKAEGNVLIANRMSAFQISFLTGLGLNNAGDIQFCNNLGWYNGADSFDANNTTGSGVKYDLNAIVDSNNFGRNGWVYDTRADQLLQPTAGLSTVDGGSATLINVAGVTYSNNRVTNPNRNCGYLTNVDRIVMHDNVYKKSDHTSLDDTDGFRLQNATNCHIYNHRDFVVPGTQYRIEGDCTGTVIARNSSRSTDATATAIITPSGTTGFTFEYNTVKIASGTFILNPFWDHAFCKFEASVSGITDYLAAVKKLTDNEWIIGGGRIVITGATGLRFQRNKVTGNTTDLNGACCIRNSVSGGKISDNDIVNSGSTASLLIDGATTAGNFYLLHNNINNTNGAGSNNFRVNPTVTASAVIFTDGNVVDSGTPTYGSSTKKVLTWA